MNKTHPKKKATLADAKRALHAMMVQDGLTFPTTPEQLDRLEAKIDDSRVPSPDVNAFKKFLRGESAAAKAPKILPFDTAAYANDPVVTGVARNGSKGPSPEIRQRMDEHRAAAEKTKCKA